MVRTDLASFRDPTRNATAERHAQLLGLLLPLPAGSSLRGAGVRRTPLRHAMTSLPQGMGSPLLTSSPAELEQIQDTASQLGELRIEPTTQKGIDAVSAPVPSSASPQGISSTAQTPPPRPSAFRVPAQLIKPGIELLKVSSKSARRVKPRRVWLETINDKDRDGADLGVELDLGGVSKQEVKLCWEKNGAGLGKLQLCAGGRSSTLSLSLSLSDPEGAASYLAGFGRSANFASVPLSRIRDLRFSAAGSPYRTSLHLPPSVEPRWVTIIYAVPPPSNFLGSVTGGAAYKLVHFIATTGEDISLLRATLEGFRDGRLARGISETSAAASSTPDCEETAVEKVVREPEVHQLCARLGMGLSSSEISSAFKVRTCPSRDPCRGPAC